MKPRDKKIKNKKNLIKRSEVKLKNLQQHLSQLDSSKKSSIKLTQEKTIIRQRILQIEERIKLNKEQLLDLYQKGNEVDTTEKYNIDQIVSKGVEAKVFLGDVKAPSIVPRKHRGDIRITKICKVCNKRKVPSYHHSKCDVCWTEEKESIKQ